MTSKYLRYTVCGKKVTWLESQGYVLQFGTSSRVLTSEDFTRVWSQRMKGKNTPGRGLWVNVKKSVVANVTHASHVCHYQFVFLSFTMDEKAASSIAFGVHDLTDPHATDRSVSTQGRVWTPTCDQLLLAEPGEHCYMWLGPPPPVCRAQDVWTCLEDQIGVCLGKKKAVGLLWFQTGS